MMSRGGQERRDTPYGLSRASIVAGTPPGESLRQACCQCGRAVLWRPADQIHHGVQDGLRGRTQGKDGTLMASHPLGFLTVAPSARLVPLDEKAPLLGVVLIDHQAGPTLTQHRSETSMSNALKLNVDLKTSSESRRPQYIRGRRRDQREPFPVRGVDGEDQALVHRKERFLSKINRLLTSRTSSQGRSLAADTDEAGR